MRRPLALALLALAAVIAGLSPDAVGDKLGKAASSSPARAAADAPLLQSAITALRPQRPGHPDLFVLGFAGDGSEPVFRNEVLFLRDLAAQRMDAAGRVLLLANHLEQPPLQPLPRATAANLRKALAGIGAAMDPEQDLLLLYLTTHGTEEHELLLRRPGGQDALLQAREIRQALDDAGIRHRVIAISACFSGGLVDDLVAPDTLVITAARRDRASFGCGNDSVATFFGRAWLADALNATLDFNEAFEIARAAIDARETAEALKPSLPQVARGPGIDATLARWRAGFEPGPALPYPHADPEDADSGGTEADAQLTPAPLPGDNPP